MCCLHVGWEFIFCEFITLGGVFVWFCLLFCFFLIGLVMIIVAGSFSKSNNILIIFILLLDVYGANLHR